jgi:hypothetical protein
MIYYYATCDGPECANKLNLADDADQAMRDNGWMSLKKGESEYQLCSSQCLVALTNEDADQTAARLYDQFAATLGIQSDDDAASS